MFDTENFIREIQARPSIWNPSSTEYCDRIKRRKCWEDIAAVMFTGYEKYSSKKRLETVLELQKKWKHLRDYYVREKNKERRMKVLIPRKRRAPFLDLLNDFLKPSIVARKRVVQSPVIGDSDDSNHLISTLVNKKTIVPKPKPSVSGPSNNITISNPNDLNPNMVFLLSILPEMDKMDERQAFDFKLEVMNSIKRIKYSDGNYCGTGMAQPCDVIGQGHECDGRRQSRCSDQSEQSHMSDKYQPEVCIFERLPVNENESRDIV